MVRGSYLFLLGLLGCSLGAASVAHAAHRGQLPGHPVDRAALSALADAHSTRLSPTSRQSASISAGELSGNLVIEVKAVVGDSIRRSNQPPDGQVPAQSSVTAEPPQEQETPPVEEIASKPAQPVVHDDYLKAMKEATEDRKLLFIYFHDRTPNAAARAFETETLAHLEIQEKLRRFVFVKLPRDASIDFEGKSIALLKHPAFAEMLGRQGVAIIDLAHDRAAYYGRVVSTFPFTPGKYYRKDALSIILDLPSGTLTQRTMIYAVRIHPERPASTQGQLHDTLTDEARRSSHYQASIQVQGHHSWDTRFHRINAKLPSGVLAQEVVAESWPNENLVEACIDCVHSWRQSPGHWGAVRSRHPLFGYDIKRGRNGIWYATGLFGKRR